MCYLYYQKYFRQKPSLLLKIIYFERPLYFSNFRILSLIPYYIFFGHKLGADLVIHVQMFLGHFSVFSFKWQIMNLKNINWWLKIAYVK